MSPGHFDQPDQPQFGKLMEQQTDQGSFDAAAYWNERLSADFSLRGVGHAQFTQRYNRWLYARKEDVLRKALAGLPGGVSGKSILDIGPGTGFFVERYLAGGGHVTGIDISQRSVEELARRFPQAEFRHLDIGTPSGVLAGRSFDIINMWDVMYHIVSEEGFANACRNIAQMSHVGTRFLMTDLMAAEGPVSPAQHVIFRNRAAYERILGNMGFQLAETRPLYRFLNRHYPWPNAITDRLGFLWYQLDSMNRRMVPYNICFSIWERRS